MHDCDMLLVKLQQIVFDIIMNGLCGVSVGIVQCHAIIRKILTVPDEVKSCSFQTDPTEII